MLTQGKRILNCLGFEVESRITPGYPNNKLFKSRTSGVTIKGRIEAEYLLCHAEVAYLSMEEVKALLQASGHVLPSESQWEYPSRAGSTTLFFWGNDLSCLMCFVENFNEAAANDAASNRFGLMISIADTLFKPPISIRVMPKLPLKKVNQ